MRLLTLETCGELQLGIHTWNSVLDVSRATDALASADVSRTPDAFLKQSLAALPSLQQCVERTAASAAGRSLHKDGAVAYDPCVPKQ